MYENYELYTCIHVQVCVHVHVCTIVHIIIINYCLKQLLMNTRLLSPHPLTQFLSFFKLIYKTHVHWNVVVQIM